MSRQTRSATKALSLPLAQPSATSIPPLTQTPTSPTRTSALLATHLCPTPEAFGTWLRQNHSSSQGLWLKIAKKSCPTPSITYDQALNEALCYGWIDGQRKSHDVHYFLQKFTPRRKGSLWSKRNVDLVTKLIADGRMTPAGQIQIDAAKADGRWERAYAGSKNIQVHADLQSALERNQDALKYWNALGKGKRYAFLLRIETAKREETRKKRIAEFVQMLEQGKTL